MIETVRSGRTVLDLSSSVAGAYCARLLASMGAEVTKVEVPRGGDPIRAWGPFPGDAPHPEKSGLFLFLNAGKRGITLDVTSQTGRSLLLKLAAGCDVIVEDSRPGTWESLNLAYPTLQAANPRVVLTSVTPFGQTGLYRDYLGTDLVLLALGGITYTNGEPGREPLTLRGPHASLIGGTTAAVATLIAIYSARAMAQGQHVDVSIMEAVVSILESTTTIYEYSGTVRERVGARRPLAYAAILPAADGDVGIVTSTPKAWETMCIMMDKPELILDPRFATGYMRSQRADEISTIIGPWVAARTKREIYEAAQALRIPFAMVHTAEDIFDYRQHLDRGFFVEVESRALGKMKMPSLPFREAGGKAAPLGRAPEIGEHNAEVYQGRLGLTPDELVALRQAGVI